MERDKPCRGCQSRTGPFNEDLPIMIGRLIEITLLLSDCVSARGEVGMNECEGLAKELVEHEKRLAWELLGSHEEGKLLKALILLVFRVERIQEKLESILSCCRLKLKNGIVFGDKAEANLQQLLAVLVDMMHNLRDAFTVPDAVLLESIISEGDELSRIVRDLRWIRWHRHDVSHPAPQATGLYLDILDAIKSANEDVGNICKKLLNFELIATPSMSASEIADARKLE